MSVNSRKANTKILQEIIDRQLLGVGKLQVYKTLFNHGPLTAKQCSKILEIFDGEKTVGKAFTYMRDIALVEEVGRTPTPHSAVIWDVTSSLPIPAPKKDKSIRIKYFEALETIVALRRQIETMKQERIEHDHNS